MRKKIEKTAVDKRMIIKIIASVAFVLILFFIPAGTILWVEAWLFLLFYFLYVVLLVFWLKKHDPALFKERFTRKRKGKTWDKTVMTVYTFFLIGMIVICGLDAVRFHWSHISVLIKMAAFIVFWMTGLLIFSCIKANTFLSSVVRVQKDRKQKVVQTGPYKIIRHPMYTGIIILFWLLPVSLGSLYGLFFSFSISIVFIIRTYLEDRTLLKELKGYRKYANKVRYRLMPGVW